MKLSKSTTLILAALAVSTAAFAQTKAPEPDYTLSYNIGVATDYRYRGISQTSRKPALQGGVDFVAKNGVYLGAWASTISWIKNASNPTVASGPVELDLYGGYKADITKDVSYDIGGLYYWYVNNTNTKNGGANANTFELYGALTAGPVTAKYSRSMTNLFGAATATTNSKGSGYLDISASFDVGSGWAVAPHIGFQRVANFSAVNYTDYSLGVTKDIDGLVLGAAYVGTNKGGKLGLEAASGKDLFKSALVLSVKKNF